MYKIGDVELWLVVCITGHSSINIKGNFIKITLDIGRIL